jgi:hypothetical protein
LFNVAESESLTFEEDGGVVQIGQTQVRAVLPWSRPLEIGRRYLVFAAIASDGRLIVGPPGIYEFTNQTLSRLMPTDPGEPNDIQGLFAHEVLTRIQERVSTRRQ